MPKKKKIAPKAEQPATPDNVQPIAPQQASGIQMTQVDKLILANCSLLEQANLQRFQQAQQMINAQVQATAERVAQDNGIPIEQLLRDFVYNHSIAEWTPRATKAA